MFFALRFCLAFFCSWHFCRLCLTFFEKLEKNLVWRRHVGLTFECFALTRSCQALKGHRKRSLLMTNSRDYISVFYPYLKCPTDALSLFRMVLRNLRESGTVWYLDPELEAFDFECLYKASTNPMRLLLAKKLLKHLKKSLTV